MDGVSCGAPFVPSNMWESWVREWCCYRRAAGRRPETVKLGAYWMRRVERDVNLPPGEVTFADLVRFLGREDWAPETRKSGRTAIRDFYSWAYASGLVDSDPARELPSVPIPRSSARPVSEEATRRVCGHTPDPRIALAAVLAARMGLRRAEIAAASVEDITDGRLYVRGKGGHGRRVMVHPDAVPLLPSIGPLVPSLHTGGHLTPGHVGKLLSRELGDAGTAHMLRHRFATVAYRGTRDLSSVQAVLGHQNLATTQRYIAMDERRQDEAVMVA